VQSAAKVATDGDENSGEVNNDEYLAISCDGKTEPTARLGDVATPGETAVPAFIESPFHEAAEDAT
jgi:hypothetical protein